MRKKRPIGLKDLLKVHIALYDRVMLEDGTYFFMSDGDGQGVAWKVGPDAVKDYDRTKLTFHSLGGQFGVAFGEKQLMTGKMAFGCNADFLPIIHKAGLTEATYFEWIRRELKQEYVEQTDALGEADCRRAEFADTLPADTYLRMGLLKGFYRDAVVAGDLCVPFAVGHHFAGFLAKKRDEASVRMSENVAFSFLGIWIELNLPNFANYSWEQIHELHESPRGDDFRRMVGTYYFHREQRTPRFAATS